MTTAVLFLLSPVLVPVIELIPPEVADAARRPKANQGGYHGAPQPPKIGHFEWGKRWETDGKKLVIFGVHRYSPILGNSHGRPPRLAWCLLEA